MKKFAFVTLLAAAGLVQVAHGDDAVTHKQQQADHGVITGIGVPPIECDEGYVPTPIGDCQPGFEP
ncbi:hypothetical protein IAE39_004234 [Pseudomonas sp. S37]|uniref:hypothetical protein n=1 Tax=Pseudomonas sp. S37 TaxID=2767449 RepID=UPI0019121660|nr:hypothetical protein [Pseudomonas sp. S37]MBK4996060.1 hypothetical protein [Pseudomonas sp. S37]